MLPMVKVRVMSDCGELNLVVVPRYKELLGGEEKMRAGVGRCYEMQSSGHDRPFAHKFTVVVVT